MSSTSTNSSSAISSERSNTKDAVATDHFNRELSRQLSTLSNLSRTQTQDPTAENSEFDYKHYLRHVLNKERAEGINARRTLGVRFNSLK